jgi:drug/metabolite transporter (DMT)-like permease
MAEPATTTITESDRGDARGYVVGLLCWLLSGGVYVAAKWAVAEMPAWTLTFWRVAIAAIVMLPLLRGHGPAVAKLLRTRWIEVLIIGAIGLSITQGFMFTALETTTAINVGLILSLLPLATMVLARIVLGEVMGPWQVVGVLVAAAGMVVVVVKGEFDALIHFRFSVGELWVVVAAILYAVYTVFLRRAHFDLPRLPLLAVLLCAAAIVAFPLYLVELWLGRFATLNLRGVLSLAYVALPGGALMYLLYNWSIDLLGAAKAGTLMYSQVIFVAVLAWLLLGESIEPYHLAGAALIFAGVALVMLMKPKPATPSP